MLCHVPFLLQTIISPRERVHMVEVVEAEVGEALAYTDPNVQYIVCVQRSGRLHIDSPISNEQFMRKPMLQYLITFN